MCWGCGEGDVGRSVGGVGKCVGGVGGGVEKC